LKFAPVDSSEVFEMDGNLVFRFKLFMEFPKFAPLLTILVVLTPLELIKGDLFLATVRDCP
jgi:hypothetical protein